MTLLNPTLIITRVVISRANNIVYNEFFREGVNIIRGENGSGKTTIIESIVYVLGGSIRNKKDEFLLCDYVYAELQINTQTYTFRRLIKDDSASPLDIFVGTYEDAVDNTEFWNRYFNRRADAKKSYSEMIFNFLGFPEEKVEGAGNITIHDILRLLYEDQNASSDQIFLREKYPEGYVKRQAISDLLLGVDDFELYKLKRDLSEKENLFSKYTDQLSQIKEILGSPDVNINNTTQIQEERKELEKEKKYIENQIKSLNSNDNKAAKSGAIKDFNSIKKKLADTKKEIYRLEEESLALGLDIEDSVEFIESLNTRLDALYASTEMTNALGGTNFQFCPSCFQSTLEDDTSGICGLCKSELKEEYISLGYLKMQNEIQFQRNESTSILKRKKEYLSDIQDNLKKEKNKLSNLEHKHANYVNALNPVEAETHNLLLKTGYIDRKVDESYEKEKLAQTIDEIISRRDSLNKEIQNLKDKIGTAESTRKKRQNKVHTLINKNTVKLIKNDPNSELSNINKVVFDFGKDHLYAVGKESPAASTKTYLKNAFFFSVFLASLEESFIRYPRFVILDNIEDSGLDTERAQQFHRDIITCSEATKIKHQIIFTTRSEVISEDLDNSDYCVGKHYHNKSGEHSLSITSKARS